MDVIYSTSTTYYIQDNEQDKSFRMKSIYQLARYLHLYAYWPI